MIHELKPIQLLLLLNFIIFESERYNSKGGGQIAVYWHQ